MRYPRACGATNGIQQRPGRGAAIGCPDLMNAGSRRETAMSATTQETTTSTNTWHALAAADVGSALGVDPRQGLDAGEVERRLAQYGPNQLPTEPPPGMLTVARG